MPLRYPSLRSLIVLLSLCACCLGIPVFVSAANDIFVAANSTWKYDDTGTDRGTAWFNASYDDSAWPSGAGQFGYGDGGESTLLGYGPDANNKYPTYYFRKSFNVANAALYSDLIFSLLRDDGAVVYLNGEEIYRDNMPGGAVGYSTLASSAVAGAAESTYYVFPSIPTNLVSGTNVLAVEVHQNVVTSSDLSFDFKLEGTLGEVNVSAYTTGTPSLPPASITPGNGRALATFRLTGAGPLTGIIVSEYGTVDADTDLTSVKLYSDDGDGNWEPASDTVQLGSTTSFSSQAASFSGFTLIAGSTTYVHVVADVQNSVADGETVGLRIVQASDVTTAFPVSASSWPVSAGTSPVLLDAISLQSYSGGTPAMPPATLPANATRQCLSTFYFSGGGNLLGMNFTDYGTSNVTADLSNVTLYLDDGDGNWESLQDTTVLGAATSFNAAEKAFFSGFNVTLPEDAYVHVVADVAQDILKNQTVNIGINAAGDVIASDDIASASWPLQAGASRLMGIYPYLQNVTTSTINVLWITDDALNTTLEYGLTSSYGTTVTDASGVTLHSVNLTGLQTDTKYYYRVRSGDMVSRAASFKTAPASTSGFTFLAYGDSQGTGTGSGYNTLHESVVNATLPYANNTIVLRMGDQVFAESIDEWEPKFFLPGRNLYSNNTAYPARGNHEEGAALLQQYFAPPAVGGSGSERYYSFNYGNTHFVCLDTNQAHNSGSAQYTWLVSDLDSAAATSATWIVVWFHHPGLSSYREDAVVKSDLLPLFESKGVDIVFNGHNHFYERHNKDGVYHVTCAGGGNTLYATDDSATTAYRENYRSTLHFLKVETGASQMQVTAYDTSGAAFDSFVVPRSTTVSAYGSGTPAAPPASVAAGSAANCLGTFLFGSGGTVSAVTLTEYGTANAAADLLNVKLFLDDGDGNWEPAQDTTQLGATTVFDGSSQASFSGFSLAAGPTSYVHAVADVSASISSGVTIGVELLQASHVTSTATVQAAAWPVQLGTTSPSAGTIDTPAAASVVGPSPTITGTAAAGSAVTLQDGGGTPLGSTTADDNGNFRLAVTAPLGAGARTLRLFVNGVEKASVNVVVDLSPDADEQPVITSPADGDTVRGKRPVISGMATPGALVTLTALDVNGNLTTMGTATADASTGAFAITPSSDVPAGANQLTVTCNGVTSTVIDVIFTDPFGVVFDSLSNAPIAGARVTIYYDSDPGAGRTWIQAVPGVHIAGGDLNPQTTNAAGQYSFLTIDGDFYISITAPGYTYPSVRTSFPAGRVIVNGSKGEIFTVAGVVIEMDHPMDPGSALLKVRKDANKKEAHVGDIVTYTVEVENPTASAAAGVYLEDRIPPGFKYIGGKSLLDGAQAPDPQGTSILTFSVGTVPALSKRTLKYQLVVGAGVSFGKYENHAHAKYLDGTTVSNVADETVKVVPDALFDMGTVIGKAFYDTDGNGMQDKGEPVAPYARIAMEDGTLITADAEGKFHAAGILPGRHVFKIDPASLPPGTAAQEGAPVIVDITPGIMAKVNFPLQGTPAGDLWRIDRGIPKPRLSVGIYQDAVVYRKGAPAEQHVFRVFTNYPAFIERWQLDIRDTHTGALVRRLEGPGDDLQRPLPWNGLDSSGRMLRSDREYTYQLAVFGASGERDVTGAKALRVMEQEGPQTADARVDLDSFMVEAKKRKEYFSRVASASSLSEQRIPLPGEALTVRVPHAADAQVYVGGFSGRELTLEASEGVAETILPKGVYQVSSGDAQPQVISVGDDPFFFVAMGDGKVGYNFNRGHVEPIERNDAYQKGFWKEGRVAYYLKGKVKGKYLITSSLDTARQQKELFKSLDPNKYYPVYGDASSTSYAAADTQGPLYLLVEWDKSSAVWGNYHTRIDRTEFARFDRTLYGGKVDYESTATTKFQEPVTRAVGFRATAKQRAGHNEFLGTGGSLYYLKHRGVIEGSDKVRIEVRDSVTGLAVSSRQAVSGSDYRIDYAQGRIVFEKPVQMLAASNALISSRLSAGDAVYVVADYEYETKDKYDQTTHGGSLQQALGDHLQVGATYVKEAQLNRNYVLKGSDATVHLGERSRITAEYAESESEAAGNFVSTDGGLSFSELAVADRDNGRAYGIKGYAQVLDTLGVSGYYKLIEKGFSSSAVLAQQGKELAGAEAAWDIDPRTRLLLRHDVQKLKPEANLQAKAQVGAQETSTSSVQVTRQVDARLKVSAEAQHQEVAQRDASYESETNREGSAAAVRADYKVTETLDVFLKQQEQLKGKADHRTTVGAQKQVSPNTRVRAAQTVGNRGTASSVGTTSRIREALEVSADYEHQQYRAGDIRDTASVGTRLQADPRTEVRTSYALESSALEGDLQSLTVGSRRKVNDRIAVKSDRTFSTGRHRTVTSSLYGLEREQDGLFQEASFETQESFGNTGEYRSNIASVSGSLSEKVSAGVSFEKGKIQNLDGSQQQRYAASTGVTYLEKDPRTQETDFKTALKAEVRLDRGDTDTRQYLAGAHVEKRVTRDHTVFLKSEYSTSRNTTGDYSLAQYKEFVAGFSYRPVDFDRFNFLGKYTYLINDGHLGQEDYRDVLKERAQVWAGEAVYDLTPQWQITEKLAIRQAQEMVRGFDFTKSTTWLMVHRLSYTVAKVWRFGIEYRRLSQDQADDCRQGILAEIARKIDKCIEMGIGYNFTDFNDDLAHLDYTSQGPFVRVTGGF